MVWAVSAIATAAGAFAATTAFTIGVTGYAYAAVYYGVTALVSTALTSTLAEALLPKPDTSAAGQAQQGVLVNTTSTVDPIPVIYGQRRYGGTLVFVEVTDTSGYGPGYGKWSKTKKNGFLHLVLVHCEGEVSSLVMHRADGRYFPDDSAKVAWKSGGDTQPANTALMAATDKWTTQHTLSGLVYTHVVLYYDPEVWTSVPTITALIQGRTCYDPRTGLVGSNASDNPAVVIRDYLTNARYGRGLDASDIDDASFIAAANYCDELVSTPDGDRKRYTLNGIVNTGRPALDNLRDMLATCRGILVFTGGKHKLLIDKPETPTFTFSEDNIVGGWSIKLGDKRSRFNRVRATFIEPNNDWQPVITVRDSATYRAEDNGLMLEAQIEYPYVTDPYQVQRLADMHLKQSRFGTAVAFRATIAGMLCEVGDVVNITHPTPGWVDKPFRIMRISLLDSDEVEINALEYDASVYAAEPLTTPRVSLTTNLPDYTTPPPGPTGVYAQSGDSTLLEVGDGAAMPRIAVHLDRPTSQLAAYLVVRYRLSSAPASTPWNLLETPLTDEDVTATTMTVYLAEDVSEGQEYTLEVYTRNVLGLASQKLTWTHIVTPATPASIQDITLTETLAVAAGAVVSRVHVSISATLARYYKIEWYRAATPGNITTLERVFDSEFDILTDANKGGFHLQATPIRVVEGSPFITSLQLVGKSAPPSDVSGLTFNVQRTQTTLSWNPATDLDVIVGGSIVFRYSPDSSPTWENAIEAMVYPGSSSTASVQTLPSGTWFAKWLDSSGNYSDTPAAVNVAYLGLAKKISSWDSNPAWAGTRTNMTQSAGVLNLDGVSQSGSYRDVYYDYGIVVPAEVECSVHFTTTTGGLVDQRSEINTWPDVDGTKADNVYVSLWLRTTNDNPAASPTWSDWRQFYGNEFFQARAFQVEVRVYTDDLTHNLDLAFMQTHVLIEKTTLWGADVVAPASTLTVNYNHAYLTAPGIGITPQNMATGDYYTLSNRTTTGFDIVFRNAAGSAISRTFDWAATGY